MQKDHIKKELKDLFKSMDFISDNFLNRKGIKEKKLQIYFRIYRQLGLAWEFLGLQCEHGEGYKKTKDKKGTCRICGKVKGVDEFYYLIPKRGLKKIGIKLQPNSKKTFENKKAAEIMSDSINFHGTLLKVDVHNSYKSAFLDRNISIAADRIVQLKERGIECWIDQRLIKIKTAKKGRKKYGGFPWEIKRKNLKNFPVIFDFDEKYRFLGLTVLR